MSWKFWNRRGAEAQRVVELERLNTELAQANSALRFKLDRKEASALVRLVGSKRSEEDILATLTSAPNHPLYEAICEVIDQAYLEAMNVARDPDLSPKQTDHALGEADALVKLRRNLENLIEQGRVMEAETRQAAVK